MNFEEMSDDELRAFLSAPIQAAQERQAAAKAPVIQPNPVDPAMGMSGPELFAAGLGQRAMQIPRGLKELGVGAFGTEEELAQYNKEKAEQQKIDQMLMSNWPAKAGSFAGDALQAGLIPARLGAQVMGAAAGAAVRPTQGKISGTEMPTRLMQAATAAAPTYAVGKGIQTLGKGLGAATQRYTPEGQEAMRLDEAANRLGVKRNVGSLDPSSQLAAFETNLPGYARTVEEQVKAFRKAADVTKDIPSKTGRSFESRSLPGENLREAVVEGGKNLQSVGNSLWNDLDNFIVQNNLPGVSSGMGQARMNHIIQQYTPIGKKGMQLNKNPILQRVSEYDEDAASMLTQLSAGGKTTPQIPFSDMHKIQTAVGRAKARAELDAKAPGASVEDRQALRELKDLYGSLMTDVDNWGTKNPAAQKMFEDAKNFWRDAVVPGVINNKVFNKSSKGVYGSNPRGYSEPSQLYSDVVSNPRGMSDIYAYMPQRGRDLSDTLQTMPDVARSLISNVTHPPAPGMGTLTTAAGMAVGSPLQLMKGVVSNLPGFQSLAVSTPAKRMYFAKDVLQGTPAGRAAFAAGEYPEGGLERGARRLWEGKR